MSFYIKQKLRLEYFCNSLWKSKTVSFTLAIMKNIVACWARFPVKLIFGVAFRLAFKAASACCLLKSIAMILWLFLKWF